jgi:hypothetical protein
MLKHSEQVLCQTNVLQISSRNTSLRRSNSLTWDRRDLDLGRWRPFIRDRRYD